MKVKIEFSIDNAAFQDMGTEETKRILEVIGHRINCGTMSGKVLDINGNVIGFFKHEN